MDEQHEPGLRGRLSKQGEEALGRIAEEVVTSPLVAGAISRALEAREKAVQAQEVAMGALGLPSAADIERLTRRLRSVSQRLESIEDAMDRLDERFDGFDERLDDLDQHLGGIDDRFGTLRKDLAALDGHVDKIAKATKKQTKQARGRDSDGDRGAALERRLDEIARNLQAASAGEERSAALEARLEEIARDLQALRRSVGPGDDVPPRAQERLTVGDAGQSAA